MGTDISTMVMMEYGISLSTIVDLLEKLSQNRVLQHHGTHLLVGGCIGLMDGMMRMFYLKVKYCIGFIFFIAGFGPKI